MFGAKPLGLLSGWEHEGFRAHKFRKPRIVPPGYWRISKDICPELERLGHLLETQRAVLGISAGSEISAHFQRCAADPVLVLTLESPRLEFIHNWCDWQLINSAFNHRFQLPGTQESFQRTAPAKNTPRSPKPCGYRKRCPEFPVGATRRDPSQP